MKIFLKIVTAFFSLTILAYLAVPLHALEKNATEHHDDSVKVLKFTNYNNLKGAELIRMVQLALKDSGFDPGPIDGIMGPKTGEAIKKFQLKNDLEPTGEIGEQTINLLFRTF